MSALFIEICAACFDRAVVASGNRLAAVPSFTNLMLREVYREVSWKVRALALVVLFLLGESIAASPGHCNPTECLKKIWNGRLWKLGGN